MGHRDVFVVGRSRPGLVHFGERRVCTQPINVALSPRPASRRRLRHAGSAPLPLARPALTSGHGRGVTSGEGQVSAGWRRDRQAGEARGFGCYFFRPRSRPTGTSASKTAGLCGRDQDVRSRPRSQSRTPTQIPSSSGDPDSTLAHIIPEGSLDLPHLKNWTSKPLPRWVVVKIL